MKNKIEVIKVQKTLLEKKANDKHRQLVASGRFTSMPSQTASLRRALGHVKEEFRESYFEIELIAI